MLLLVDCKTSVFNSLESYFFMHIRPRTVIVFLLILAVVFFCVKLISLYWVVIFFNVILLFINSVFLFAYFEIKPKEHKLKNWPSVSIVVPNYNGANNLVKCIEYVKNLEYSGKKEIIVVDDGSTDSSRKILKRISGIKLILNKKNKGKAGVLNDGISASKGEIIVTIDSDTYPEPDCLTKMVPLLKPGVSAVTGFVRASNTNGFVEKIQEIEYLVSFGFFQKVLSDLNAIMVTPGPMSIYDAKFLRKIGGFDEKNITEDMEIAFRIRENGGKMVTCTEAHIFTEVPTNIRHLFTQRVRWYRGKFMNTLKYSKMLFNPKYGDFGVFTFPFSVIMEWCVVLFLFIFVAGNIETLFYYFTLVASFLTVSNNIQVIVPALFSINSSIMFYVMGACFYAIFIYYSHILANDKLSIKKLPEITLFIMVFGVFLVLVFFTGFFKEINKSDYVW